MLSLITLIFYLEGGVRVIWKVFTLQFLKNNYTFSFFKSTTLWKEEGIQYDARECDGFSERSLFCTVITMFPQ